MDEHEGTPDGPRTDPPAVNPYAAGPAPTPDPATWAAPPAQAQRPPSPEERRRSRARWLLGGLGAVVLVGGGIAALVAAGASSQASADCLEGTWTVDPESVRAGAIASAATDPQMEDLTADAEVEVAGTQVLTFDDGVLETGWRKQQVAISLVVAGQELVSTVDIDGTVLGKYEARGDRLLTTDQREVTLDIAVRTTVDGEEVDVPGFSDQERSILTDTEYRFTCDGDRLELKAPAGTGLDVGLVLQRV